MPETQPETAAPPACVPPRSPRNARLDMLRGIAVVLVLLFVGVAAGAYPVVRRLTRRLEGLKRGVEQFGAGNLAHRVDDSGKDEVAALAGSFNQAAERIETS